MRYIYNTTEFSMEQESAVTLGKFDGLHRGHQKLLNEILKLQKTGYYGIAFVIAPENRPSLYTSCEQKNFLESYGIDCMIRCPFVPEILNMEPETFISEVLLGQLKARYIVVGTDFRFGRNRSGDVDLLCTLQKKYGYTLKIMEKERYGDREISSTYIREALSGADMELIRRLMGDYYPVEGTVLHGRQLGRKIGMPTINLRPDEYKLLPPPGVYYSDIVFLDKNMTETDESNYSKPDTIHVPDRYHGITNIGYKPTVDGSFLGVETYLYGIRENLYGRKVKVLLRSFRRPEQKFSSVEELKAQMKRDILSGKEYFGGR